VFYGVVEASPPAPPFEAMIHRLATPASNLSSSSPMRASRSPSSIIGPAMATPISTPAYRFLGLDFRLPLIQMRRSHDSFRLSLDVKFEFPLSR
jgi:hypothetical protein